MFLIIILILTNFHKLTLETALTTTRRSSAENNPGVLDPCALDGYISIRVKPPVHTRGIK